MSANKQEIGSMGIRSDEEIQANIRRVAEEGRVSAFKIAQGNREFLAAREAMLQRIAAEEAERSLRTQQGVVALGQLTIDELLKGESSAAA